MKYSILIENGHIIDPFTNINQKKNVAILGNKIVEIESNSVDADLCINAEGCYVFPGLIDFHTHLFYGGSEFAVHPDLFLASGVTSAVDAGSCGYANFEVFYKSIVINGMLRIKSYISVNSGGLVDPLYHVNYYVDRFNLTRLKALIDKYGAQILGLKIMLSKSNVGTEGLDLLDATIALAKEIGDINVVVHVTDPPFACGEIAKRLRPGDVYCHCFSGTGNSILDETGKVAVDIIEAKKRGVFFDCANGKSHYSHGVAESAIKQGFVPDIISTDMVSYTFNVSKRVKNMPHLMSKYLGLGIDVESIIRAVTDTPAKIMKMEGKIGTITNGAYADISIQKIVNKSTIYEDINNDYRKYDKIFVPMMTVREGKVLYCNSEFDF